MPVTLFVRGISCIVPGLEGFTDHVRVVSIVGRLLEHSRIYGFGPSETMKLYLSSADLMTRNMDKRIEIAWPILDDELRDQIVGYLDLCMNDTAKLRELLPDKSYTPLGAFAKEGSDGVTELFESQEYLIKRAQQRRLEAAEEEASRDASRRRAMRSAQVEQPAQPAADEARPAQAQIQQQESEVAAAAVVASEAAAAAARAAAEAAERMRATASGGAASSAAGEAGSPGGRAAALEADEIEPPRSDAPGSPADPDGQALAVAPATSGGARKPSLLVRILSRFVR